VSRLAFLPVYRVAFAYQVRQGRSWTPLEHLLLWRLSEGRHTTETLAAETAIPVRIVVEALINLMQAGWVNIAAAGEQLRFEASELGIKVLKSRELPPETNLRKRGMTLLMDRVGNEFLVPEDVTLVHKDRLPEDALKLEPRAFKLTVDPKSCLDRLDIRANEVFEQWIDYRVTSQQFFAQVSMVAGELIGLPAYISPELRAAIVEEVGSAGLGSEDGAAAIQMVIPKRAYRKISIAADDLVVGGKAHKDALEALITRARSRLIIHSCFISAKAVSALVPFLLDAAKREVQIDLLWGVREDQLDEEGRADLAAALKALDNVPADLKQWISLSAEDTGSHAKVVIADTAPGRFEAIVGSCNWLSTVYSSVELSVRVRDAWLVGDLAALLAGLRMPPSGRWSPEVHRLVAIRGECATHEQSTGNADCRVIIDGEHLLSLREARDLAVSRIVAGCDLFGKAAEISAFVPMRGADPKASIELLYARATKAQEPREAEAVAALAAIGIHLKVAQRLHGKFLSWDEDDILITSFNWLATTADPWKPKGAEIGLHIRQPGLADELLTRIRDAVGIGTVDRSGADAREPV
jgi:hypothetical protein